MLIFVDCSSVVEQLPSLSKALGSFTSVSKQLGVIFNSLIAETLYYDFCILLWICYEI